MKKYLFKFRKKILPALIGRFANFILSLIARTCRFHITGLEEWEKAMQTHKCIITLWHNKIPFILEILKQCKGERFTYTAIISNSRDGEILASLAKVYKKYGTVLRIPHNAKEQALKTMINHIKNNDHVILFAPDGPKGPAFKAKPGVILAAKYSDAAIVPLSWSATRCWKLKTWDKMMFPKPFSTISVRFGPAILFERKHTVSKETETKLLEKALLQLEE